MGTYSDSKITVARKTHHCQLCEVPVEKGARQLVYKQGLKSQLYMHIDCALLRLNGYRCRVLEDEAKQRVIAGDTCSQPFVGHRCCLPPGHSARFDHQWIEVQP